MSKKHSFTTADYLPWDTAMSLIRKLYNNKDYRLSLLFGCGCFFGLRISDLKILTWTQILDKDEFVIVEHNKTGKRRVIHINSGFKGHIKDCHASLGVKDDSQCCFLNRYGSEISLQMINRHFKSVQVKYRIAINNFSTHTMRKTWARRIWENENALGRGEQSLVVLSEMMNHSSVAITRRYLGLRQQEIGQIYESLSIYTCGLRFSDIATLRWEEIDVEKKLIRHMQVKGHTRKAKTLTIPISDEGMKILEKWAGRYDNFVFGQLGDEFDLGDDERLKASLNAKNKTINTALKVLGDKINLSYPLHFHVSRHTFATLAINKKVDVKTISTLMGHSSVPLQLKKFMLLSCHQLWSKLLERNSIFIFREIDSPEY